MRLSLFVIFAGCGRVGFSPMADDAAVGPPQPDLVQLLPDQVPSLVGYWRMDGDWRDASPRGNDLVLLTGTQAFTADAAVGSAAGVLFDTSFQVTSRPSLEVAFLSFSVWFRSDLVNTASSNSGQTLFRISCPTCGGDPEIDIAADVLVGNDGAITMVNVTSLPAGSVDADRWHHVVGVYAPGETRMYLDGQLASQITGASAALQTSGGILWIGQLWPNRAPLYNPQYLHGAMDELAIWSSALSDTEASAIYANQRH